MSGGAHVGSYHWSGPEYGDVWECDLDCPGDHTDDELVERPD